MTEKHDSPEAAVPKPEAEPLPYNSLSWKLDRFIVAIGKASSWLWIGVLLVVLANVFARFVLNAGSVALEEMSWHLFGAAMMLTLSYAVVRDDHVRVDVLHEKFSLKTQAVIELVGLLVLALPIIYLMIDALIPYAYRAFELKERSQAPSGLPYRFIFKSVLPLSLVLVWVALFSRALRCSTLLFRFPREIQIPRDDRNGGHSNS